MRVTDEKEGRKKKISEKKNNTRKSYTRIVICLSTVRIIVVYFFFVYTFVLFVIVMYVVHVLFNLKIERSFFRRAKWLFFFLMFFFLSLRNIHRQCTRFHVSSSTVCMCAQVNSVWYSSACRECISSTVCIFDNFQVKNEPNELVIYKTRQCRHCQCKH